MRYRVHWVIFLCPDSPSLRPRLELRDHDGQQLHDDREVMYGMIPRAKIAICVSAPPENRLMNWRTPPVAPGCELLSRLDIDARRGDVRAEAGRRAMISSVKRILLRRSGTWNALTKAFEKVHLVASPGVIADLAGSLRLGARSFPPAASILVLADSLTA